MMGLLTRNLGWKLLSLGLAVLLWLAIVRDPELTTLASAPVLFRGMPDDFEINSELSGQVQLEVRGPSGRLTPESLSDAAVVLDLGNVHRPGDRTYTIQPSNVSLPSGVSLLRAVPAQVRLHFERRVSREVPVRVRHSAPPPLGYEVQRQIVQPERLRIIGPQSNVEQIDFADTDSIDLSGVVSSAEYQVNAFVSDPQVRFESPPSVSVMIVVQKTQEQRN